MARTRRPLVVYVEDEPAVQRLVEFWLEDAGFGVVVAGDGTARLAAVREQRPALAVTAAIMPGLNGDAPIEVLPPESDPRATPTSHDTATPRQINILILVHHALLA